MTMGEKILLKIKQVFAKFWPVTINRYNREVLKQNRQIEALKKEIQDLKKQQANPLFSIEGAMKQQTEVLIKAMQDLEKQQRNQTEKLQEGIQNAQTQMMQQQKGDKQGIEESLQKILLRIEGNASEIGKVKSGLNDNSGYCKEILWAEIFESATKNSLWLSDKTFSPGRWAVGYQFLYVMYRVLNEAGPQKILELGLGQSTRMIAQYAMEHEGVEHIVVEDSQDWVSFFTNNFSMPPCSKIEMCETDMVPFQNAEQVRVYKGLKEKLEGKRFDFIAIDAPWGGDMKQYARIDILQMLPECLSENFVILFDDCQRIGEQHTVIEIEEYLKRCGISYKKGKYTGKKECIIFCAEQLGFLTTM